MKQRKIIATILLIAAVGFVLCGCGTHMVRFYVGDTLHSQQKVADGKCPAYISVEEEGMVLRGWQDENGEMVDVTAVPITDHANYSAVLYPALDCHSPYLFVDEKGMARPNDALTCDDLTQALIALADMAAKKHFPPLPTGSEAVSRDDVRKTLTSFFLPEEVDAVLPVSDAAQLLRWEFATAMNLLLQRGGSEQAVFSAETKLPIDLFRDQGGVCDMLEATVPHETSAEGILWQNVEIFQFQPGFLNIDGWLYYLQENGRFLMDGDVGTLHFDENGRYTSGDAELDAQVAEILSRLISENPDVDNLQLLRQCQIYCRDTFQYLRRNAYEFGATGWEIEDAKTMITTGRGNCYNFAAAFWALARGLGYEAYAISGTCLKDQQPHSWVMIAFDGEEFFFDPEWEWAYRDRGEYNEEMFKLSLSKAMRWGYRWTPHW